MISRLREKQNKRLKFLISETEQSIEMIRSSDLYTEDSKKKRIKKANQELNDLKLELNAESNDRLLYDEEFRLKLKSILIFLIIITVLLIPIVLTVIQLPIISIY